jgi:adenine-specific DNA-methyltransferase
VFIKTTRTGYSVNKKVFVDASLVYESADKFYYDSVSQNGNSRSIIDYSTNDGTDVYNQILEAGSFNNPKNVQMLKYLISLFDNKDALVLDFFAGSGTLGQAVLEINDDDEGNRKFILCTNNENGIAENITYERVKKVVEGYGGNKGIPANIRYFTTDFVSKKNTDDQTRAELVERSAKMICVREDTFEALVDDKDYKIFEGGVTYSAIVFNTGSIDKVKKDISKLSTNKPVSIYVFSLSNDTYESDFADLERTHELRPIPESILDVYRRIFTYQKESMGL